MTKNRIYSLDLLRMIAMLLVVAYHSSLYTFSFAEAMQPGTIVFPQINYLAAVAIKNVAAICVDIFWLICGYFMIDAVKVNGRRFLLLWIAGVFWSVITYPSFGSFFPVVTGRYWFLSDYLAVMLLAPALNRLLRSLDRGGFATLAGVLFAVFSVVPSFAGSMAPGSFCVAWALVMYVFGAGVRLHLPRVPGAWRRSAAVYVASVVGGFAALGLNFYLKRFGFERFFGTDEYFFVVNVVSSLALFRLFLNLELREGALVRMVKFATPAVFGVYLIHESGGIRPWLWSFVYDQGYRLASVPGYFVAVALAVPAIFVSALLVEKARLWVSEKTGFDRWVGESALAKALEGIWKGMEK